MHYDITHERIDLDLFYAIWNQLQPSSKTLLWFMIDNCSQISETREFVTALWRYIGLPTTHFDY